VVHRDSDIQSLEQLADKPVAFPSPAAFAASILPRTELKRRGIAIQADYVSSHEAVYLNVAAQRQAAGGGVVRTLNNSDAQTRDKLRILWKSEGYTPHAIAAHPRVPHQVVKALQETLLTLDGDPQGPDILKRIMIAGFEAGADADWNDIRALRIDEL
jgi:phosphonate transport system substrate-binding protein